MASHYHVLGVTQAATDEQIRTAYKQKALFAHPDKGGSASVFNKLHLAYETLRDAKSRAKYDEDLQQERRKKRFKAPPKVDGLRMPERFPLPDGTLYDFETAPDRLRCKFRHGDVVRHTDGEQGVFIGIAGNGVLYWAPYNVTYAVPLNTFGGERDITVLYRNVTAPRASRAAAPTAAAGGSTTPGPSARPPAGPSASNDFAEAAAKRHAAEEEKLAKQRASRLNREVKQLEAEEQVRRESVFRAAEKYFSTAYADMNRGTGILLKQQQAKEESAAAAAVPPLSLGLGGVRHSDTGRADDVDVSKYRKTTPRSWHTTAANPTSPALAYRSVQPRTSLLSGPRVATTTPRGVLRNGAAPPPTTASSSATAPPPPVLRGRNTTPSSSPMHGPASPSLHPLSPPVRPAATVQNFSFSSSTAAGVTRSGTPVNVRLNNAYMQRRVSSCSTFSPSARIDDDTKQEYDAFVQEALKRANTPNASKRSGSASRQTSTTSASPPRPSQAAPPTAAPASSSPQPAADAENCVPAPATDMAPKGCSTEPPPKSVASIPLTSAAIRRPAAGGATTPRTAPKLNRASPARA